MALSGWFVGEYSRVVKCDRIQFTMNTTGTGERRGTTNGLKYTYANAHVQHPYF